MLKFGGVEAMKQDYRARHGLLLIENFLGDLRNATRTISRMPALAAVIIFSLAIGIGVNTTIFSWIQMILFQPLPPSAAHRTFCWSSLAQRRAVIPALPGSNIATCSRDYRHLRDLIASQMVPFNVGAPGQTERTHGQLVSGNFFSAVGTETRYRSIYSARGSRAPRHRARRCDFLRLLANALSVARQPPWDKRFASTSAT